MRISIKTPSGVIPIEFKSQPVKLTSPLALLEIRLKKNESCDICEGKSVHHCKQGQNQYKLNVSAKNNNTVRLKTPDTLVNLQLSCAYGSSKSATTTSSGGLLLALIRAMLLLAQKGGVASIIAGPPTRRFHLSLLFLTLLPAL